MKNIFDYLLDDQNTLHERPITSFAEWMFPGTDSNNTLSRKLLRWSVQCIANDISNRKPTNLDFYNFFHELDQNNPAVFFTRVSKVGEIKSEIEEQLGNYPTKNMPESIRSTFLYFIGTVMKHVADESLFPETPKHEQPTKPHRSDRTLPDPFDKKDNKEFKNLSNVIYTLFAFFLTAFILFNFLFTR